MSNALQTILEELRRREPTGRDLTYRVPSLWRPVDGRAAETANPYAFHRRHIEAILAQPPAPAPASDWIARAVIYNVFVRLTAAFDHDGDGALGTPDGADVDARTRNAQGIRETGTFLKCIALLGHIRRLGCNAIHLLPVTAVGRFGNKGALGSPYAIRNPYRLEPTLADPLLEAGVETQFRAFVEACHHLGMPVVVEFVFRTSSRDGDWVAEHPEWYYWIRREVENRPTGVSPNDHAFYGLPPFGPKALKALKEKVAAGDLTELPPPPRWYRDLFRRPPARVEKEADGRWRGTLPNGSAVHVPSAFADWPPDDYQPPWTDVTYLRMYDHPDFNYIAYNTIRMYDTRLARPEHAVRPLWDAVRGIIPHYQKEFGIDGVMVDMGHALPHDLMHDIIADARRERPDFALLSENFHIGKESKETGYDAVLGYQFTTVSSAAEMRKLVERTCVEGLPIAAFGTSESHNTPRTAMRDRGAAFCRTVWLANAFLPDTIPFIHAGFELADTRPVNLGLAFTPEELREWGDRPLGLFDACALDWEGAGELPEQIAAISALRESRRELVGARGPKSFAWLDAGDERILAFRRTAGKRSVILVLNWDATRDLSCRLPLSGRFRELLTGREVETRGGILEGVLEPGWGMVLEPVKPA